MRSRTQLLFLSYFRKENSTVFFVSSRDEIVALLGGRDRAIWSPRELKNSAACDHIYHLDLITKQQNSLSLAKFLLFFLKFTKAVYPGK